MSFKVLSLKIYIYFKVFTDKRKEKKNQNGRYGFLSYFLFPEPVSLLHVQSKVLHGSLPGAEQICSLCSPHRREQCRLCSAHGKEPYRLAPHSFRDQKISKNFISANFKKIFLLNHLYLRSPYDLSDQFKNKKYFEGEYL